jgi:hypothetical protein
VAPRVANPRGKIVANGLDITALIQQDEGQFFDRKSLWEGVLHDRVTAAWARAG